MLQKDLRLHIKSLKISRYLDYRNFLEDFYKILKQKDSDYTYIKYSSDLGFGHCNAMNLIVHGKRPLTLKSAKKIATILSITGPDKQYFLKLVEFSKGTDAGEKEKAFQELAEIKARVLPTVLDQAQLEFYTNWYNAAILELLSCEDAQDNPKWICKKLYPKITELKAQKSLDLLQSLGLISYCPVKQKLVPSLETFSTGSEVQGIAILSYHQQMIDLAKVALTNFKYQERDISSITVKFSHNMMPMIKSEIAAFRKKIIDYSNKDSKANDILQLNIQLFPLAKNIQEDES